MSKLGSMSPDMTSITTAIDEVGWVGIMHGHLLVALQLHQQ